MEDLLLAVLSGVFEILLDVLFQVAMEGVTALAVRSIRNKVEEYRVAESEATSPILAGAGYLLLGAAFGGVSVYLFPHPLVHPSKIHGISLVVSPVITGLIMSQVGSLLRRTGKDTVQIESFGYGFAFAFGVAVIRFLFVR